MFDEIEQLRSMYQESGGISYQDIKAKNWIEAHFQLGQLFAGEINQIIANRFTEKDFNFKFQVELANLCLSHLKSKLDDPQIGELVNLYLNCLKSWADGCALHVDNCDLSKIELAVILQNDVVGCITTLIRNSDGDINLIHSEEDVGGTIKKPTIINFIIGEDDAELEETSVFIYPSLLPGPAFSYSKKMVMANDFLYVNHAIDYQNQKKPFCLVNVLTWCLFIRQDYQEAEIYIQKLQPFMDGNALNLIDISGNSAKTIEVAGDQFKIKNLPRSYKSYQVQVNIFNQSTSQICQSHERVDALKKSLLANRVKTISKFLEDNSNLPFPEIAYFQASREGGKFAPANEDVKATFLANVTKKNVDYKTIAGPLLKTDFKKVK